MKQVTVTTLPTTVSATAALTFTIVLNVNYLATGDVLTIYMPSPNVFIPSTTTSLCSSIATTVKIASCSIFQSYAQITLGTLTVTTISSFSISVGNFVNPFSTTPVTGISLILTTSVASGSVTKESGTSSSLNNLIPDAMTSASLTPGDMTVGSVGTTVTITIVNKNTVKSTGQITVQFPYWNPSSSLPINMVDTSTPSCTGVSPVFRSLISCTYNTGSRIVTLLSPFAAAQAGGTTMIFTISNVMNPYNTAPKSGFIIQTQDSSGGSIDQFSTMTMTVSNWALLTQSNVDRADGIQTVGEQSEITNYFKVPVPVDANCRLRIDFPSDMPLTSALTGVAGSDLFAYTTSFATFDASNNYIQIDGCSTYRESDAAGLVYLSDIVNPAQVKTTGTYQYSLYAMQGSTAYKIAHMTSGITFLASVLSTGLVNAIAVASVDTSTVQATTRYVVTFQPQHTVPTNSQILITFPSSITLTSQTACTLSSITSDLSALAGCSVSGNVITLTNAFGTSGQYTENDAPQSFIFSVGGTNPYSVTDAGTFQVQTFATIGGNNYPIDIGSSANLFTPTPSLLPAIVSSVSSYITYDSPTNYILQVTPDKAIPSGGIVKIIFPTAITLANTALTACKITIALITTSLSTCSMTSSSPVTLTITNAFPNGYTTLNTPFNLEFDGLTNPRTMATTGSFTVATSDASGNAIESVNNGVVVQMTSVNSLTSFTVAPVDIINGQTGDYRVTVTTKAPMYNGDQLKMTFPTDFSLATSLACGSGTSVTTATCVVNANTITAGLQFTSSPVSAGSTFSFLVKSLTNPPNTAPTATFTNIAAYDSSNNELSTYTGTVTTKTTTPATVTTMSLAQDDQSFGTSTNYYISYTTVNPMAAGAAFLVNYPSSVSVSSSPTPCYVSYATVQYSMYCIVNSNSGTVAVYGTPTGALQLPQIPAGSSISVVIGTITNPASQLVTVGTLSLTSYTDSNFQYTIDNIPGGLIPGTICTYPCKTCLSSDKTKCVTCFTTDATITSKYLTGQSCSTGCLSGYYADSGFVCHTCSSQCKTCSTSTTCDSCNTGGAFPLLYNSFCYLTCPDGTYASSGTCLPCNSNCLTCSGSSTTCKSCDPRSGAPYLSNSQCITACANGYVPIAQVCQACNSPCSTCIVDQNTCVTCTAGYKYGTKCVTSCATGMAVVNGVCVGCDPNCASCSSTNLAQCFVCKANYLVLNNTCYTSCPVNYVADSAKTYCTYVAPTTTITVVVTNNVTNNITTIVNHTITVTVNNTVTVTKNNTITITLNGTSTNVTVTVYNSSNSSAISSNSNGSIFLYFPVTTTQTILTGVAVGSHFKCPTSNVHSSMLGLWGPLEFVAYGAQAYLAYQKQIAGGSTSLSVANTSSNSTTSKRVLSTSSTSSEIWPLIFYGTLVSMGVLIITNLIFMVVLCSVMRDVDYRAHRKQFCGTHWCIHILGSLISYKVGRFLYARFYGGDRFAAPFKNPQKIHNALNCLTILNMCLSLAPIIFVDIYGIIKYSWGDQFYMIIIETLILSFFIILVSIWEFKAARKINIPTAYAAVNDNSTLMEDSLMKKLELRLNVKLGGHTIEQFIERLKKDRDELDEEKNATGRVLVVPQSLHDGPREERKQNFEGRHPLKGRCQSMIDLVDGREMEEDPRHIMTDPLNHEDKMKYENQPNPFIRNPKSDQPNNCIAMAYKGPKKAPLDKSKIKTKVIQTGENVMTGEEYDKESDKKLRKSLSNQRELLEQRKDDGRNYEKNARPDSATSDQKNDTLRKKQRDSKMRGRKDKYYDQVEDEDLSFAEDSSLLKDGYDSVLNSQREDQDLLQKIDEEGSGDEGENERALLRASKDEHSKDAKKSNNHLQVLQQEEEEVVNSDREGEISGHGTDRENLLQQENEQYQHNDQEQVEEHEQKRLLLIQEENRARSVLEDSILDEHHQKHLHHDSAASQKSIFTEEGNEKQSSKRLIEADDDAAADMDNQNNQQSNNNEEEYNNNDNMFTEEKVEGDQQFNEQDLLENQISQNELHKQEGAAELKLENEKIEYFDEDEDNYEKLQNREDIDDNDDYDKDQEENEEHLSRNDNNDLGGASHTLEDDILKLQQQQSETAAADLNGLNSKFNTTHDIQNQLEQELLLNKSDHKIEEEDAEHNDNDGENELDDENANGDVNFDDMSPPGGAKSESDLEGEPDSDDDYEQRMKNMVDPNKRRFNVNDILGDLDRDEKGNLILQADKKGKLVDKNGTPVNEKGYLINPETGDVLENQKMKKVFDKKDIDERGEIPPPFNLEKFNFNPHDIRGYFDRDSHGDEIIGNRTNDEGKPIDKLGRLVNSQGYLIDKMGNLVDKRGRIRLHHRFMEMNRGNLPLLFNYKGKKYDIRDVIGDFDKDRSGNIIIRRDKDNKMVDKKGRKVNNKGYLLDEHGNVINQDGKVIFEHYTLSQDNEIPKFFPFIKFNINDIQGEFEMDPLGNPMLSKNSKGELIDNKGRVVNAKGYLLDEHGNVINKRGYKVFSRVLLEADGDIPKVFRTGLLRKDTVDSFSQLMNEIEDLELLQEMEQNNANSKRHSQHKARGRHDQDGEQTEQERMAKKIEKIIEEDGDDDDLLMKELEELAHDGQEEDDDGVGGEPSEGGNTSVDSMMEDTPSNYNIPNQRFMEEQQQQLRERARQARGGHIVRDIDEESMYEDKIGLPGRKLKKKPKKKKKVKKPKEAEISEQDLLMARAYGGMSQAQYDRLLAEKRRRDALLAAGGGDMSSLGLSKPPTASVNTLRNASNSRVQNSTNKKIPTGGNMSGNNINNGLRSVPRKHEVMEDIDWDAIEGDGQSVSGFNTHNNNKGLITPQNQNKMGKMNSSKTGRQNLNNTSMQRNPPNNQMVKKNNLMGSTQNSFNGGNQRPESQDSNLGGQRHPKFLVGNNNGQIDRRLSNVANSVSGFYRDPSMDDKMRSTHESNFAYNMGNNQQDAAQTPIGGGRNKNLQRRQSKNDPELERIYGTGKGLADMTMLSDWEKDSRQSNRSRGSQMSVLNTARVKGLESIYLQRLEPANKGRKTVMKNGQPRKEDKAKFRIMHHKFHDEPEWHASQHGNNRDELDSVISGNYKDMMESKFREEFQGPESQRKRLQEKAETSRLNIFHGNFSQYKEKKNKEKKGIDLGA